jgi:hypothetical protein
MKVSTVGRRIAEISEYIKRDVNEKFHIAEKCSLQIDGTKEVTENAS